MPINTPKLAEIVQDHPHAFNAAYDSLMAGGHVKHSAIRSEISRRILVELVELRAKLGPEYMRALSLKSVRAAHIHNVWDGDSTDSIAAIDAAMAAAARVLAEG